ncbi:acetyl-CoA synthetase (ADP-forming), alpha and beta subunit fusion [Methanocella conradii HZ254]|uniref:acetate--CoA ligase (ADP-forming) n=1 Tax=Methanocella conradii (strain DSM 24694 / JCM 17849 / CGMCC 1.5162 / HZ254) TaxID=1041930 RepID=H8I983_METCZ|nr:acetate--CoA ligase [Methanocella conradii]AFC99086.1 acetyl-CoA synthetase (ADP-forming), alpha and beta subunit fusion [Methanocella conradii HZ254]
MLEKMFNPESVAVIGASHVKGKVGRAVLDNLLNGYEGKIYPINPNAAEIEGLKCYKTVLDVPGPIDLAVIVIPSKLVPQAVRECGEKGIKYIVIISAGFKEVGVEGARLENEVKEIARSYNMRIVGPNCLGVLNTHTRCNASFAKKMPPSGNVSIITQSGALGTAILDWSEATGVGFDSFVSLGNKADLNEIDFMEAWKDDENTKVILAYLEGITDGKRFIEVAREVSKVKPIIVVKSGRTSAGARAVSSHTGSLAGSDAAYDAAFMQSGVIRAETMYEFFDMAGGFSGQPIPKGDRIAIITNAGGPGILATDSCERYGLRLATLSKETVDALKTTLPAAASFYNPVDVLGDASAHLYRFALETVVKDSGVDGILVLATPQAMTDPVAIAEVICDIKKQTDKPILPCFIGGVVMDEGVQVLKRHGLYNYDDPARAAYAMRMMARYNRISQRVYPQPRQFDVDREKVRGIIDRARKMGITVLGLEALPVLEAYGIPTLKYKMAAGVSDALQAAREIGYPVVMKIVSPDIVHKSDVGGVRVGIGSDEELENAYNKMMKDVSLAAPRCRISGVLIQQMATGGKEVILGMNKDPQFGPLIMFGLGGIYVEVLKDVQFRVAPLNEKDAMGMIYGIKTHQMLEGTRGEKPSDIEKLAELLERLSQLVTDFPDILEMDINPVKVYEKGKGCLALDVRMAISPK